MPGSGWRPGNAAVTQTRSLRSPELVGTEASVCALLEPQRDAAHCKVWGAREVPREQGGRRGFLLTQNHLGAKEGNEQGPDTFLRDFLG